MLARLTASLTLPMHALLVQLILFPTPVLLHAYLAHMEHQPMVKWEKHVVLQVQTSYTTHVVLVLLIPHHRLKHLAAGPETSVHVPPQMAPRPTASPVRVALPGAIPSLLSAFWRSNRAPQKRLRARARTAPRPPENALHGAAADAPPATLVSSARAHQGAERSRHLLLRW